jgi:hypothetical protein
LAITKRILTQNNPFFPEVSGRKKEQKLPAFDAGEKEAALFWSNCTDLAKKNPFFPEVPK